MAMATASRMVTSLPPSLEMLMGCRANRDMAADHEYLNPARIIRRTRAQNGAATAIRPDGTWPPTDPDYTLEPAVKREDACNISPALISAEVQFTGGTVADFFWNIESTGRVAGTGTFDPDNEDDLPLPMPRTLQNVEQLIEAGLTERQVDRLRNSVTVYSYDTNVIANYIQDVAPDEDLVNAFQPGDWQFTGTGATLRTTPQELQDTDDLPDLRFDAGSGTEDGKP